jgi:excisionase family DNA binding protein
MAVTGHQALSPSEGSPIGASVQVPALLLRSEAAQLLRVSGRTIDRLVAAGELTVVRIGRQVRVRADSLAAFAGRHSSGRSTCARFSTAPAAGRARPRFGLLDPNATPAPLTPETGENKENK